MKICHVLRETAHGPLTYRDLSSGGRGVTGSEQAMLYLAKAQAAAGHHVLIYLPTDTPGHDGGVQLLDSRSAWPRFRRLDGADVVISWTTADPLRNLNPSTLRIHSLQINDWLTNGFEYEKSVDVFVAVSEAHKAHLLGEIGAPTGEWEIVPNGTALVPAVGERMPRRCVYLSSPDRGLHWILAMWPEIRFAFPDAELHVYYEIQQWLNNAVLLNSEVGNRAMYVVNKINDLKNHGVVLHGAVPPEQLASELAKSDVMLYPCDPIKFTEGFGVAVLDACRAGVVPVITDADALGEIYGMSGAVVVSRNGDRRWTDCFLEASLRLLGSEEEKAERRKSVQMFSKKYLWEEVATMWQSMITRRLAGR